MMTSRAPFCIREGAAWFADPATVKSMLRLLFALSVAAIGCSDSSGARAGDGGPRKGDGAADAGTSRGNPGSESQVRPIDISSLERPADVPALSFKAVPPRAKTRARSLNGAGLKLYGRRDYRGAIAKYSEALRLDPGHILARYNLSCAYNLIGEPDTGLALLNEFRQKGCKQCRDRLVRAAEDADWYTMWNHPLFVEIVGVPIGDGEAEKPFWQRPSPCPPGARLSGKAGVEVYCARAGVRHGDYAKWHPEGTKAQSELGAFKAGRRDGVWKIFDSEGRLRETGPYRLGKKHGVWSQWYPSGVQALDGRYVGGLRQGRFTWFEESGAKIKQADFERGKRGPWILAPK